MSINIYQMITDKILQELEKNIVPWRKPWQGGVPINYVSRKPYHGINLLLLPYGGEWLSFKQIQENGGKVKKGEKSSMVVFFKMLEKNKEDTNKTKDNDADEKETFPFLRYSNVFHITQTEGIETKLKPIELNNISPIENSEKVITDYIQRSGVQLKTVSGSNEAYYQPSTDTIVLPDIKQFDISEEYYSVAFHEAAHSTGHQTRLDRISKDAHFGSQDYSKEELIAEISSCMTLNYLNIDIPQTFQNSISYIDGWRKKLKEDNKIILTSANQAQKATNLILNISNE